MRLGSVNFESYNRTLRRVMWAEFLEEQLRQARLNQFRASIVANPYLEQKSLVMLLEQNRNDRD